MTKTLKAHMQVYVVKEVSAYAAEQGKMYKWTYSAQLQHMSKTMLANGVRCQHMIKHNVE